MLNFPVADTSLRPVLSRGLMKGGGKRALIESNLPLFQDLHLAAAVALAANG